MDKIDALLDIITDLRWKNKDLKVKLQSCEADIELWKTACQNLKEELDETKKEGNVS